QQVEEEERNTHDGVMRRIIRATFTPSEEERLRIRSLYRTTTTSRAYATRDSGSNTPMTPPIQNHHEQQQSAAPLLDDDVDDTPQPLLPSHYKPRYLYRYINVLRWLLLLVAGYAYNRFFCEKYNIPRDSDRYTYLGHSTNLANLAMFGIIQAWFVEVIDDPKRSKWIFSFPRWWFFITFFAASTVFTLLGMLDALSHNSISPSGHLDRWNAFSTVLTVLASLLLLLILWHVWYSIKVLPTYPDAAVYILSRFGVVCTFGVTFLLIHFDDEHNHDDNPVTFHLHHYFIAWLLSLIAAFDHPISLIMYKGLQHTQPLVYSFVQGTTMVALTILTFSSDNDDIPRSSFLSFSRAKWR
ncbi:hypothetical protein FOZ63_001273, partial [Perkinsus olseni]